MHLGNLFVLGCLCYLCSPISANIVLYYVKFTISKSKNSSPTSHLLSESHLSSCGSIVNPSGAVLNASVINVAASLASAASTFKFKNRIEKKNFL